MSSSSSKLKTRYDHQFTFIASIDHPLTLPIIVTSTSKRYNHSKNLIYELPAATIPSRDKSDADKIGSDQTSNNSQDTLHSQHAYGDLGVSYLELCASPSRLSFSAASGDADEKMDETEVDVDELRDGYASDIEILQVGTAQFVRIYGPISGASIITIRRGRGAKSEPETSGAVPASSSVVDVSQLPDLDGAHAIALGTRTDATKKQDLPVCAESEDKDAKDDTQANIGMDHHRSLRKLLRL